VIEEQSKLFRSLFVHQLLVNCSSLKCAALTTIRAAKFWSILRCRNIVPLFSWTLFSEVCLIYTVFQELPVPVVWCIRHTSDSGQWQSKGIVNKPFSQNFGETCKSVWKHGLRNKYWVYGRQCYNVLCGYIVFIYCNCYCVWRSRVFRCRFSNTCHMHSLKTVKIRGCGIIGNDCTGVFCSVVENVVMFTFCGMFWNVETILHWQLAWKF
jgi:hypothetical protein